MKKSTQLESALDRFLPANALSLVCSMLREYPHHLIITQPRSTKHGDFKTAGHRGDKHEITVNGNLNKYAFLITLMHELAHLVAHVKYGAKIKPHGEEWKQCFRETLTPFLHLDVFPDGVARAVRSYLKDPGATTHGDAALYLELSRYDRMTPNMKLLIDVQEGALFVFGKENRVFKKGRQLRKRFECIEMASKNVYLFDPVAKVLLIPDQSK